MIELYSKILQNLHKEERKMAQKKKKGPAPNPKVKPKRKKTTTEKVMIVVGALVALSMLAGMLLR